MKRVIFPKKTEYTKHLMVPSHETNSYKYNSKFMSNVKNAILARKSVAP